MRLVYPWLLLLLSAIPVAGALWLWLHYRSQSALSRLISPALQPKLAPPHSESRFYAQFVLVMTALTLLLFAAARPQWGRRDEKVFTRGRNLMIALDVSRSMLAADVHPNRLERAKTDIIDLIEELQGDRAGLLAFRYKANVICPLTTDYTFLRQALDGVSIDSAPRGATDLGDAIVKSLEALEHALDEYNAILLISDGEDLSGTAVKAAEKAAERGIPIFTVGIGDPAGTTIPAEDNRGSFQFEGRPVMTRLMDQTLSAIARISNGRYIPLGTAGTAHTTLGAIYRRHLRHIADKEQQEMLENRYRERYQLFLVPAVALLLAAAFLSRGRLHGTFKRRMPVQSAAALLTLWLLPLGANAAAATNAPAVAPPMAAAAAVTVEPGRAGARKAQSWLKRGEWRKAAEAFLSASRGADIDEIDRYRFNAAYAFYRDGDTTNACDTLRSLLNSRPMAARAGELLGKIRFEAAADPSIADDPERRLDLLEETATAFQRALRQAPDDERRTRNLARATLPLDALRDDAHIAKVIKEHAQKPPDQLVAQMLAEQREIMDASHTLFTNAAPAVIAGAETLAQRQQRNADLWIPLKQALLQAVTNRQQQAVLAQQIELGRDSMRGAAAALEDLLPSAGAESAQIEPLIYNFWKMTAAPNALIDEDILCQSNTLARIDRRYLESRDSQREAAELTTLFIERFPEWADQYIQQAQADTNMPPFTAEDKAEIEELAAHALKLQTEVIENNLSGETAAPLQRQALAELLEIREKLPKNPGSSGAQNQQQQQDQQQDQQQQPENNEEQPEPPPDEPQPDEPQKPDERQEPPPDVRELLRRALEREKEHEEKKKQQMRAIPLPPDAKDW